MMIFYPTNPFLIIKSKISVLKSSFSSHQGCVLHLLQKLCSSVAFFVGFVVVDFSQAEQRTLALFQFGNHPGKIILQCDPILRRCAQLRSSPPPPMIAHDAPHILLGSLSPSPSPKRRAYSSCCLSFKLCKVVAYRRRSFTLSPGSSL